MKVILAQPRGFCAGVVRAIEIVERALQKYGPPVYVRHEIVHNKHVVESLKAKGAHFVEDLSEVPPHAVTIFSAHGVAKSVEEEAAARELPVLNATCPLVTKVHNQGKRYVAQGRRLILIGHAGHPEVEGTMGQISEPVTLVQTENDVASLDITNFYFETYQRLRAEQPFFRDLAAFSPVRLNVRVNGQLEPSVQGQLVSGNYFAVLGTGAVAGRAFTQDDDRNSGGHPVAMISYQYWQNRFALSSSAIGQEIFIDGTPFTIVGVTPPGFFGLEVGSDPAITVPLTMQPQVMPDKENWLIRSTSGRRW